MKTLIQDIITINNTAELIAIGDTHIGSPNFDEKALDKVIDYILSKPNVYVVLNGDILDCNFSTSPGSVYTNSPNPQRSLEMAYEKLSPIKDRILVSIGGNHDHDRSAKMLDISFAQQLAVMLGIQDKFSADSAVLFLTATKGVKGTKRNVMFKIFCSHGNNGGGGTVGSKANALQAMSNVVCGGIDVFIHSHTHQPMIFKDTYFEVNDLKKCLIQRERLYVNTNAFMNYEGSYGEKRLMRPQSMAVPIIRMKAYRDRNKRGDQIRKVLTCEL